MSDSKEIVPVDHNTGMTKMTEAQKWDYADKLAKSGSFPGCHTAYQAFAKIQAGAELGLPPYAAMKAFHSIENNVAESATLFGALIKRSKEYDYKIVQCDGKICKLDLLQHGKVVAREQYTWAEVEQAENTNKKNYQRYPSDMLFSRCISRLVRRHLPHLTKGSAWYEPTEMGVETDPNKEVIVTVVEKPIELSRLTILARMIAQAGTDVTKLLTHFQVESLGNLTAAQGEVAIGILSKNPRVSGESNGKDQSGPVQGESETVGNWAGGEDGGDTDVLGSGGRDGSCNGREQPGHLVGEAPPGRGAVPQTDSQGRADDNPIFQGGPA